MSKPNLLAIGDFYDWDMQAMEEEFTILRLESDMAPGDFSRDVRDATKYAARIFHRDVGNDVFDAFPNLEIVANYGVGYDGIDADEDPLQRSLGAGKAGIIGLGRIGTAIAHRLAASGCDIAYFARSKKPSPDSWTHHFDLTDLARDVDYLINVLPGGPETDDMINRGVLEALGPEGVFVNIGRGSSVDEEALFEVLKSGKIHGAALDVFKNEPNVDKRFFDFENVLLQPHAASATVETRKAMGKMMRDNLSAAHQGMPLLSQVN